MQTNNKAIAKRMWADVGRLRARWITGFWG